MDGPKLELSDEEVKFLSSNLNKRLHNNYARKVPAANSNNNNSTHRLNNGYGWYLPKFLQYDSGVDDVLVAPTFYPTAEEFRDPMAYMAKIIPLAEKYGLCKIVPPEEHELPTSLEQLGFKKRDFKFTTKIQNIHLLQSRGKEYKDGDNGFFSDLTEAAMEPVVAAPPEPKSTPVKRGRNHLLGSPTSAPSTPSSLPLPLSDIITPNSSMLSPEPKKQKLEQKQAQTPDCKEPLSSISASSNANSSSPFVSSTQHHNNTPSSAISKEQEKHERTRMMSHFGFERGTYEFNLSKYQQMADAARDKLFSGKIKFHAETNPTPPNLPLPLRRKLARRGGLQRIRQLCYYDDLSEVSEGDVECEYWKTVENGKHPVTVQYGSDLDVQVHGTGFPKSYKIGWNTTRLAQQERSLLNYMPQHVPGINSPMMYVGMMFSSFCWHTEDNYLFSINYIHSGACKSWYSIPSNAYAQFEVAMRKTLPELFDAQPNLLHMLITMLSPRVLRSFNVPIYKMLHEAGTYMITFPRSYHAGFNHGFNVAESVNFAPPNWVAYGRHAIENYRICHRPTAFSHEELVVNTARNFKVFAAGDFELIRNELQIVLDDEKKSRQAVLSKHTFFRVEEHEDLTINKKNLRKVSSKAEVENAVCEHCQQDCYLSFVTNRTRTKTMCLRDFEQHMGEQASNCIFFFRLRLEQLQDMVNEINKAIAKRDNPNATASSSEEEDDDVQ